MVSLGSWMNEILINWGVDPKLANMFDETIIAVLMIGVSIGLDYLCQAIFVGGMKHYTNRAPHQWNTLLMKRRVVHHLIHILPGILVYFLLPLAFVRGKEILDFSQKICAVYIIAAILFTINGLLLVLLDVYNARDKQKNRPMKGFVQVLQVLLFFIGGIVIIAVLVNKSPMTLFAGLGASAAVLMLVFKDSILGFVAGVQLSANDMLRIGDWIQLPNGVANGTVEEITLNTVKIRNWDETISTVPPYTLVNNSFQNWRGMQESGGRRVNKNIYLDMTTLKFCTPEDLDAIRKNVPLMADYQPAEGEVPTNSQLYRIYIERYLRSLPVVNQDMDLIISQKEPTTYGVPIQVYFFSRNKVWREYERIQSDIFDHLLAIVGKFDLKLYQYSD
ncbi:mechanosensitive ion channel [Bacteroides stercoris]|jgi:small-conductance mechanosensitive channel|uniref:Mechanosensitive ion channel n=1 Tax=Bacteroides stercoris TaxID=46506 RepID=A0A414KZ88_BACSE|nr:mechanosensitive ion channel domain-containing protein [Bacteroides stercoris]KAB5258890.1 mechanosensitive ion channel [Bacteroides stercoris]KAB5259125.1 mechanosensitive ion channel [Bacteroides stercoris]KAB5279248.1 mechanosensitive ion channel [Bacteroides stercoris]KAB5281159.1 mechanosensitive ion channel [Bacteroides stercoris]KAB5283782.1 mechanosensitive ion channel [Bacteroides stercoris]